MLTAALALMIGMAGAPAPQRGMYLVNLATNGEDAMFLDLGSVEQRPGRAVRFWNLHVDSNDHMERNVKYQLAWSEVNCSARTLTVLKVVEYGIGGSVIYTLDDAGSPQAIVPDSRADDMRELVCTPGALRALDPKSISLDTADAVATFDDFVVAYRRSKGQGGAGETAVAPASSSTDALDLALADMEAGRDESALANFNRAVTMGTRDPSAFLGRAIVRARTGDQRGAMDDYDHAIALDSSDGVAYAARAQLRHEMADYEGTASDATRALQLMPAQAYVYDTRGWAYIAMEQWDLASRDFNTALKLDSRDTQAWAGRGAARSGLKDYELALKDFDSAAALQPDGDWIYVRRGATYLVIGNYDAALADFSRAILLNPGNENAKLLREAAQEAKASKSAARAPDTVG